MGKFAKNQRRAARNAMRNWQIWVAERLPGPVRSFLGPVALYADMLFVDYGIFRMIYLNRHKMAPDVWRSAQPAPHHIRSLARKGVRTVVNLRGARDCGAYWLEQQTCEELGLNLVDLKVRSRAAPTRAELHGVKELFERIEYPILLHCKSGADRAGLVAVLYCHLVQAMPMEQAKRQLSLKYGHIRQADTGILDYFFEAYQAYNAHTPMPFFDWVDNVYDAGQMQEAYPSRTLANIIVNIILRRE